jgi:type II secretory pathway pseudopilin PulG
MMARIQQVLRARAGFTLIESVATLSIVTAVLVGLVSVASGVLNTRQVQTTMDRMNEIRRAIAGNPVIVVNEARTSFGYLGDMGVLPTQLSDLWKKPTGAQSFTFNSAKKTGAGWNGPYLELSVIETASALGLDGWGTSFGYPVIAGTTTDGTFSALVIKQLRSLGPNLQLDSATGADDLTINFFKAEVLSRVQGYVRDSAGNGVSGVEVTVNYPQDGVLVPSGPTDPRGRATTEPTGFYAIEDIPFGNRSITIVPKLVLAPGTIVVSGNANQNLEFTIKNFSAADVSIAYVVIEVIQPLAYFRELKLGNTSVYSSTTARLGQVGSVPAAQSQVTVSPAEPVTGTQQLAESIPIRIQSPITDVSDLVIGDIGRGGSLVVQMNDFSTMSNNSGTAPEGGVFSFNIAVRFEDINHNVIGSVGFFVQ